jgi:DNA-binding IscR family transcriptional regulator
MTIKQQIIIQLSQKGAGTSRQLADRTALNLSSIRSIISELHRQGSIKSRNMSGKENVWEWAIG